MRPMNAAPVIPNRLTVSIVLYESSLDLLRRALASLDRAARIAREPAGLARVDVELVDNSTTQAYRTQAAELASGWASDDFFQVSYTAMPDNRGFGAGHNTVIQSLDSAVHLVLNPDVELSPDALAVGLAALQDDAGIALVSPRATGDDGRQEFLCKRYPSVLVLFLRAFGPRFVRRLFQRRLSYYQMRDVCAGTSEAEVMLASGCFMLVRSDAIRAAGGFNEGYFLYFEDFDLSLRLSGQGRLIFNPAMHIVHHGGYAASKGMMHLKYFLRSGITFFNQHGWRWI